MKTVFKRLAGIAAAAALTMPTLAQAADNPAAGLSLNSGVRASAKASNKSQIGKSTLINLGIFAVIVAGILVATTTGGDDDKSDSN